MRPLINAGPIAISGLTRGRVLIGHCLSSVPEGESIIVMVVLGLDFSVKRNFLVKIGKKVFFQKYNIGSFIKKRTG